MRSKCLWTLQDWSIPFDFPITEVRPDPVLNLFAADKAADQCKGGCGELPNMRGR